GGGAARISARADVAQLVERRLPKPKVAGSRPVVRFSRIAASRGKSLQMRLFGVLRAGPVPRHEMRRNARSCTSRDLLGLILVSFRRLRPHPAGAVSHNRWSA